MAWGGECVSDAQPGMEVVGNGDGAEAGALREHRALDQLRPGVLLARQEVSDPDHREPIFFVLQTIGLECPKTKPSPCSSTAP